MAFTIICLLQAVAGQEDKLAAKLKESAEVYLKDSETLSYYVQQDKRDPTRFSIFERYEQESSLEQHLANPYYATFVETCKPLLEGGAENVQILHYDEL